jgi:hypothetical protein
MPTRWLSWLMGAVLATSPLAAAFGQDGPVPSAPGAAAVPQANFDRALRKDGNWYFSWGYSRQQYAPTDIHVSQPDIGSDFVVRNARASDFPSSPEDTLTSLFNLDLTNPQNNVRIGKFLNLEKTFAVELSIDHSKYNVDLGQTVTIDGAVKNVAYNKDVVLTADNFNYTLHNGLNHVMVNAVWLRHLRGPENQPGDLQLISRVGAGLLIPHADNTIFGNANEVGPKNTNVCCFSSTDWWQINGWTAGVEVGLRYRVYKALYVELTAKGAYGVLRGVPVYKGTADQVIWMSEQVLSTGFLF